MTDSMDEFALSFDRRIVLADATGIIKIELEPGECVVYGRDESGGSVIDIYRNKYATRDFGAISERPDVARRMARVREVVSLRQKLGLLGANSSALEYEPALSLPPEQLRKRVLEVRAASGGVS